jgi:solute carrier family 13 (sodium-dependent dicarboxylate transporter), member 2/3/5
VSAQNLGITVTFAEWFFFAAPLTALMLAVLYVYMTRFRFRVQARKAIGAGFAREQLHRLGPMSFEEKAVLAVFATVGTLWIGSGFLPEPLRLSDTSISMIGAVSLFLLPARKGRGRLMGWPDMRNLPWGLLLLFGGGLSLAAAFESSGLTMWFGGLLEGLQVLPLVLIVVALAAIVLLMTEIMSNTAVSNMLIPVGIGLALGIGADPHTIMAVIALSASCAFMLPISTPPNAAVFSSDYITINDMVGAGIWMNIAAVAIISAFVLLWQPVAMGG